MSRPRFLAGLLRLGLPFAIAACGGGSGGSVPRAIGTLAYVVTDCHEDASSASASQRLEILQGDRPAVTVLEIPPVRFPGFGLCALFAALGAGGNSVFTYAFQRLAVSPDGSGVVFEVTFDFSPLAPLGIPSPLTPEEEGIFYMRADGSGLRRLGPASREPSQRLIGTFSTSSSEGSSAYAVPFFAFSPNGKAITFMDRGLGPADEDAPQVVILDIATGERTQVTRLPDAAPDPSYPALPATGFPTFADDDTLRFFSRANPNDLNPEGTSRSFTVNIYTGELTVLPAPVVLPGSKVVPSFSITGPVTSSDITAIELGGTPVNPDPYFPPGPPWNVVYEIFAASPDHLLQLTNFGRIDTGGLGGLFGGVSTDGQRVFFTASADPFGTNPSENCQIFSIDVLGGDLRQLTEFRTAEHSTIGCLGISQPPVSGCWIPSVPIIDPEARTLIFDSTCDPRGANPNGEQFFAMRSDGTGLRQLTATRGVVRAADGSVDVELPGPGAYSVPLGVLY